MKRKDLTPITCWTCRKRIVKGHSIYRKRGYVSMYCSAECMLYVMTRFYTEESTGYIETQDKEEKE